MERTKKCREVRQESSSDCGPACLASVISFYGGRLPVELSRELCDTGVSGTSMKGLAGGAEKLGMLAEGYRVNSLAELDNSKLPLILHTRNTRGEPHYVVLCGISQKNGSSSYEIMDPAIGMKNCLESDLLQCWTSRVCLHLVPGEAFKADHFTWKQKIRWLWDLTRDFEIPLLIILLFGGLIALFNGLLTLLVQRIVDVYIPTATVKQMFVSMLIILLLLLGKEGVVRVRTEFMLRQTVIFNKRLFDWFCSRLLQLPTGYFEKRTIGDFNVRFRDAQKIQHIVFALFGSAFIDLLFSLVIFGILFYYDWRIGLTLFLLTPFYIRWVAGRANRLAGYQLNLIRKNTSFEQAFISVITAIRIYKIHQKERLASNYLANHQGIYQDAVKNYGSATADLSLWSGLFTIPILLMIIFFTALTAITGQLTIGEFVSVIGFLSMLIPNLTNLAAFSVPLKEASIAFNRLSEFQLTHSVRKENEIEINSLGSIRLLNLQPYNEDGFPFSMDMNINLPLEGLVSITGENGSGKTTLLNILMKLNENYQGRICINEHYELRELSFSCWMKLTAIVPQDITLISGTLLENIAFEDAVRSPEDVLRLLNEYQLNSIFQQFPQGYQTLVDQDGATISGGQKQLIGIARALYKQPRILLLDEATSALDEQSELWIQDKLLQWKERMLIICVCHKNQEFVAKSDLKIEMSKRRNL